MSTESHIRYFLGANTPDGFYSFYDELLDPREANDYFILKGGPGCGKSTLMRRVSAALEEAGQPCEYIVCSGDPDSLDAVLFPAQKAAIVDGTAPHVVEPKFPGVVESYVNVGSCYDKKALCARRLEIMSSMSGYQECYQRAYRCLDAAAQIAADTRALLITPTVESKAIKRARGIMTREVRRTSGVPGRMIHRFLSAVTHKGALCLFDTVDAQCKRVYALSDSFGLAHLMLAPLAAGAVAAGYDIIACPSPMDPQRLEHVIIPALSLAFVTSTPSLPYPGHPYRRIRLDAIADADALRLSKARLRFSRKVSAALVSEAVESLSEAKSMHDRLEALYNPYVDFERVHLMGQEITEELLSANLMR